MPDRFYQPKSTILLTGAGFSKPFGGYLASEMWAIIFNQLKTPDAERLRILLRRELNYEAAYDLVMSGDYYSPAEQSAFTKSLGEAYGELDRSIRVHLGNNGPQIRSIQYFIERFAGEGQERGFVFTLNQDILLERFGSHGNGLLQIPALGHPDWFSGRLRNQEYPETDISHSHHLETFREKFWEKGSGLQHFLYIKLHGSYGWRASKHGHAMVIGYDKVGSIAKEPLLKWYFDIFREVLSTENITLVVVGYGFMDLHINQLIAEAAKTRLRLHVVSPIQPKDFQNQLFSRSSTAGGTSTPYGREIWEMLCGYHCTTVEKMVPGNVSALPGATFFEQVGL